MNTHGQIGSTINLDFLVFELLKEGHIVCFNSVL